MKIIVDLPVDIIQAAEAEAARRGISPATLIKNYLAAFLPDNIKKTIKKVHHE